MIRPAKRLKAAPEQQGPTTRRAWGYIRVSTRKQVESGLGLESQRQEIIAYAANKGFELAGIYEDHVSATVPLRKRPAGLQMCLNLKAGDTVICKRLCRLFRKVHDAVSNANQWREVDKVNLVVLDLNGLDGVDNSTKMGNFIFTIMAAVLQLERDMLAERTKDALAQKDLKGRRTNPVAKPGYWWKIENGKWTEVEHPETMAQIAEIQRMYAAGMTSHKIVLWCQKEASKKRFLRVMSKIRKRKEGERGYDPQRVDVYGRYRVSNHFVPWGYNAILNVMRKEEEPLTADAAVE